MLPLLSDLERPLFYRDFAPVFLVLDVVAVVEPVKFYEGMGFG